MKILVFFKWNVNNKLAIFVIARVSIFFIFSLTAFGGVLNTYVDSTRATSKYPSGFFIKEKSMTEEERIRRNEANRRWAQKNKEYLRIRNKKYREKFPEKEKELKKRYYEKNKLKVKQRTEKYRKDNLLKYQLITNENRCKELKVYADNTVNAKSITKLLKKQKNKCSYCGIDITKKFNIEHKTPLSRGGTHTIKNVQLTCRPCNIKKFTKTHEEYLVKLKNK